MHRTILSIILMATMWVSCDFRSDTSQEPATDVSNSGVEQTSAESLAETEPNHDVFGIDQSFDVITHVIRRNESLSTILRNHGLSPRQIHELGRASAGVFDVRRMRSGRPLHIYKTREDSSAYRSVAYAVYEDNASEFVRFHLSDSLYVERDAKEVDVKLRLVSGSITNSLYQTMRQLDVDPQLARRLADVFAWQVDFYRIQPGDRFKVLFEEIVIDGEAVELGRIKAAIFTHHNEDFYAFHYRQDNLDEYFDEKGNSLRRQFMAAPLDYTRISSRFSNRRYHPVLKRNIPHHGTDYAAPVGTPIRAVGDGVITVARYGRNNGNYIRIRHNSVYETGYLHMSRFTRGMQPGTEVEQGQIIGYVGATGLATGPHLCFRFWQHGQPVDPQRIDLPPADPIQEEHRVAFAVDKRELLAKLGIEPDTVTVHPPIFAIQIGYNGVLSENNLLDPDPVDNGDL